MSSNENDPFEPFEKFWKNPNQDFKPIKPEWASNYNFTHGVDPPKQNPKSTRKTLFKRFDAEFHPKIAWFILPCLELNLTAKEIGFMWLCFGIYYYYN